MIERILNIELNPEVFLLGLMDPKRGDELLFQHVISVARLLYTQRWKDLVLSTIEELLVKLTEFAKVTRPTFLMRGKLLLPIIFDSIYPYFFHPAFDQAQWASFLFIRFL